jgi:hypothetical protein
VAIAKLFAKTKRKIAVLEIIPVFSYACVIAKAFLMTDTGKTPAKNARPNTREAALEKALRDNLRRRKAAQKDTSVGGTADLHEKASGKGEPGA